MCVMRAISVAQDCSTFASGKILNHVYLSYSCESKVEAQLARKVGERHAAAP